MEIKDIVEKDLLLQLKISHELVDFDVIERF
jgi:hypothetical protein